eukprot:symbB.v1.2.025842.t2/scaffold2495.1/size77801/3
MREALREKRDTSEHALRRAYRLMVKESHPDKGGSNELTAELTSLRDSWLREPLRFHVFRAMFDAANLQPFDMHARAQVELQDGWPYLQVELELEHYGLLMEGGSWTFAFGLKNGSTVHYRGDERTGGYDVCCDFLRDSRCQRHALQSKVNASESTCQSLGQCDSGLYAISDCPLPTRIAAKVRRPLHQNITGQWGGALQVRNTNGEEVACIAFAFAHQVAPDESVQGMDVANSTFEPRSELQDDEGSARASSNDTSAFQHVGSGSFCEDGGDLLEGALDNYGGLSPFGGARRASAESSLFYGSRCRERCRRRPLCRFYTAYSSGWCQLSSRCSVLARAGDPLTMVEIGDEMMAEWSASSGLSSRSGTRDDPQLSSLGIEQLRKREVWQKALMGVARSSKKSLIHSSVRRNLVEGPKWCGMNAPPLRDQVCRTNSLLLEEQQPSPDVKVDFNISMAEAAIHGGASFRLPEIEEIWPDLPPRRCPVRQNWRRSASLSRLGAERISEDAGAVPAEEEPAIPSRLTSRCLGGQLTSQDGKSGCSRESMASLTIDIDNKISASDESESGKSHGGKACMQAKEDAPARHASTPTVSVTSRYRSEATPFASARSLSPSISPRNSLSEEDALAIVREWAAKQIPDLLSPMSLNCEAERCSILKNFPAAKKTAVVLFGKPDEDFKDWVKQKMRLQYEAEKAELERKRSSAEAAGEEPPTEELKEPPEADFLPSGKTEVSERALAHDLRYFSLPSKAEGFDEIRYEWTDEVCPTF